MQAIALQRLIRLESPTVRGITRIVRPAAHVSGLAEGLDRSASVEEGDLLAVELLRLRRRDADLAVATAFSTLGPDARARFFSISRSRIDRALEGLLASSDSRALLSGCRIAAESPSPAALYALAHLVSAGSAAVSEGAAAALRRLAGGGGWEEPAIGEALDGAIARAAAGFPEHRRKSVMEAAALAAGRGGPAMAAWLRVAPQESLMALRAAIRRSARASDALRLMRDERLAPACVERLRAERDGADRAEWLERAPGMLLHAKRRRALRRAGDASSLIPTAAEAAALPAEARRAIPSVAARLSMDERAFGAVCADRLTDPDELAQLACVRRLDARSAAGLLADYACAGGAHASRSAAIALAAVRGEIPAMAARREEAGVRAHATLEARFADPLATAAGARLALARDRDGLIATLRREMCGSEGARRIAALLAARRLGVAGSCEFETLAAAGDHDPRIAATAALTLGSIGTETAREALVRLAGAPDARVRANALEALARAGQVGSMLEERRYDPHPRSRGNAVLAGLLGVGAREGGLASLKEMLADTREAHRVSALWVAERAAETGVAHRVAAMIREERSPGVVLRARRCARRLIAALERGE